MVKTIMKGLNFDPEGHKYTWDGIPVPGVTEILKETGQSKDWKGVDPFYRDRGTAVHKAIELWGKQQLDESSLDPVIVPYLNQFTEWASKEPGAGLWMMEQTMYSGRMDFAGTVDLIHNQCIYDVKCSKKLDKDSTWQYSCQGSGYRTLVKEHMNKDFPFRVLLLTGEGPAQVIPMYSPYGLWENVMGIYNHKLGRPA